MKTPCINHQIQFINPIVVGSVDSMLYIQLILNYDFS